MTVNKQLFFERLFNFYEKKKVTINFKQIKNKKKIDVKYVCTCVSFILNKY